MPSIEDGPTPATTFAESTYRRHSMYGTRASYTGVISGVNVGIYIYIIGNMFLVLMVHV